MTVLLSCICLEGAGRKYLPFIPSRVFYFLKDVVLLVGLLLFGVRGRVLDSARRLYRGFGVILALAFSWTVIEMFNPSNPSLVLAMIGLRAYWLWWLAPLVIASAIRNPRDVDKVILVLGGLAVVVAAMAAYQFASPADASVNLYAMDEGRTVVDVALVQETGRARVSSTFAYITGFTDFAIVAPCLLLSLGLSATNRRTRWVSLTGAAAIASAAPMGGSRGPVLLAGAALVIVVWQTGFLRSSIGRRIATAGVVVALAAVFAFPVAVSGVQSRFEGSDTSGRFWDTFDLLPPVSIAKGGYPMLGVGTGTQQNARLAFGAQSAWDAEGAHARYLLELGAMGYLLVWTALLGLSVGLVRMARDLRRLHRRSMAGAALAFALFAFVGNMTFDHIWESLFFVGAGLLLQLYGSATAGPPSLASQGSRT
jgi:uncharacterized membrane protein YhaH (DUF805 family)